MTSSLTPSLIRLSYPAIISLLNSFLNLSSIIDQHPGKISGLQNLGNSCYMNAIIQSLYATEVFRNYVTKVRRGPLNMG